MINNLRHVNLPVLVSSSENAVWIKDGGNTQIQIAYLAFEYTDGRELFEILLSGPL